MPLLLCSLVIWWISLVRGQSDYYSPFYNFSTTLPIKLTQNIAFVYNDTLWVFGGVLDGGLYNYNYYKLDLSALNLQLTANHANIEDPDYVAWENITISPPTYGHSTSGVIRCYSQCSVLLGQYLYIVASPSSGTEDTVNYAYRLDLTTDPPQWSADTDWDYDLSAYFGNYMKDTCLTTDGDVVYMMGGWSTTILTRSIFMQYNPTSDGWTELKNLSKPRQSPGCAVSRTGDEVLLFGGRNAFDISAQSGSNIVDVYTVSTNEWSDSSDDDLAEKKYNFKCATNPYWGRITCFGGFATSAKSSVDYYRVSNNNGNAADSLFHATQAYGLAIYEFVSDNSDVGSIILVIGGDDVDSFETYDSIQYSVWYNAPTEDPTSSPTMEPTTVPTTYSPTFVPTVFPTTVPSKEPTTFAPTTSPETSTTSSTTKDIEVSDQEDTKSPPRDDGVYDIFNYKSLTIFVAVFMAVFM